MRGAYTWCACEWNGPGVKVLELIDTKPRFNTWPSPEEEAARTGPRLKPATCQGLVEMRGVNFTYPARPDRKVRWRCELSWRSVDPPNGLKALSGF